MRHAVEAPEDPAEPSGEEPRASPIPRPTGVQKEREKEGTEVHILSVYFVQKLVKIFQQATCIAKD